jgi:ectoine hydroxylase
MVTEAPSLQAEKLAAFERDGYVVLEGALSPDEVERMKAALDRVYAEEVRAGSLEDGGPLHTLAFCGRDATFLELLDHPAVLPTIVELLGPNIYMYHCHCDVHPPEDDKPQPWGWHQDGGVMNRDLESEPRPRISVKVGYFLSDVSEPGRGNFMVLPGSHLQNRMDRPEDDNNDVPGATPILAKPGDALLFDRRLWHMRSPNRSDITRRAMFFAYIYRWVRPRDELPIRPEVLHAVTPVRAQLLGGGGEAINFWMPDNNHLPIRDDLGLGGKKGPRQSMHQ